MLLLQKALPVRELRERHEVGGRKESLLLRGVFVGVLAADSRWNSDSAAEVRDNATLL